MKRRKMNSGAFQVGFFPHSFPFKKAETPQFLLFSSKLTFAMDINGGTSFLDCQVERYRYREIHPASFLTVDTRD